MSDVPNVSDQKEEGNSQQDVESLRKAHVALFNRFLSKLAVASNEIEEFHKKIKKVRETSMILKSNVFAENDEETRAIRLSYDEQINEISTCVRKLHTEIEEYDNESWQSEIMDVLNIDTSSVEEFKSVIEFLKKKIEEAKGVSKIASEIIDKYNDLNKICNDILRQSKTFQMKKNILKFASSAFYTFKNQKSFES